MHVLPFHSFALFSSLLLAACGGRYLPEEPDETTDSALTDSGTDSGVDTSVDLSSCSAQNDCVLAPNGCCGGPCGIPELEHFTAVNRKRTADFAKITCTDPLPTCPGCVSFPNNNLFARCMPTGCKGVDLRTDSLSSCSTDADCRLRYGGCCEECAGPTTSLVAMRKDGEDEFLRTTCLAMGIPCPPCVPSYPAGASARCDPTTKHCVVILPK